jgi:N-acetylglucosaminyl-diphospho-decaprenol L-rhamnosyltransferase
VVDNASRDGSAEMVRSQYGWVRLLEAGGNLGFGGAVNLVAQRTATPWLAPANADLAFAPGALAALVAAGDADPAAGALAPRLLLADGSTQHSVHPFPTLPFTLAFNLGLPRLVPGLRDRLCLEGSWNPERERHVPWAVGALLLVRRAAWDRAGGFDAQQWMYAEDLDLGWKLHRAGWQTRYVPAARVRHDESAATAVAFADRTERWTWSTYAWMLRRRGIVRTRAVAAVNVAGALWRWAWLTARGRPREAAAFRRWATLHRIGLRPRRALEGHR